MQLEQLSFGVGDRFAHQTAAQLRAFPKAVEMGVDAVPTLMSKLRYAVAALAVLCGACWSHSRWAASR